METKSDHCTSIGKRRDSMEAPKLDVQCLHFGRHAWLVVAFGLLFLQFLALDDFAGQWTYNEVIDALAQKHAGE